MKVIGAEGLLRWEHPIKGLIMPGEILPFITETHQHTDLTLYLLTIAFEDIQLWHENDIHLKLSINVPAVCMTDEKFYETLFPLLEKHKDFLCCLDFEITEQTAMSDLTPFKTHLEKLRGFKIDLSIDDFGTGYSSLLRLLSLPFSEIKIDRTMIMHLPDDEKSKLMLEVIFDLAKKMNMKTCGEGVETKAQEECLISMGCNYAQGFLYAPALEPLKFIDWAKAHAHGV